MVKRDRLIYERLIHHYISLHFIQVEGKIYVLKTILILIVH